MCLTPCNLCDLRTSIDKHASSHHRNLRSILAQPEDIAATCRIRRGKHAGAPAGNAVFKHQNGSGKPLKLAIPAPSSSLSVLREKQEVRYLLQRIGRGKKMRQIIRIPALVAPRCKVCELRMDTKNSVSTTQETNRRLRVHRCLSRDKRR